MHQLELFQDSRRDLKYWDPIPGMPGYYIMSTENREQARRSYNELKTSNPIEWERIERIKAELKSKLDSIINKP